MANNRFSPVSAAPAQPGRRHWLGRSAAGLALAGSGAASAALPAASRAGTAGDVIRPLDDGPTRSKFGLKADFHLPVADVITLVPFDRTFFREGGDCTLLPDGMIRIETAGLYRVSLTLDWVAQQGRDIDLRLYGIRRKRVGSPGGVQRTDDYLASASIPGSDPPRMARHVGPWTPGRLALGQRVSLDVPLTPPNVVAVGDLVLAQHSSLADGVIGADAADGLLVQARVLAPDRARVTLRNLDVAAGVDIPAGELKLLAMTGVQTRGESADAWQMVHTASEKLQPGELIYATGRNKGVADDYIQSSRTSFIQLERLA